MIIQDLKEVVKKAVYDAFGHSLDLDDIKLSFPPNPEMGDFTLECFFLAKDLRKSPVEIAQRVSESIEKGDLLEDCQAIGPYVNLKVVRSILFRDICSGSDVSLGSENSKKVMVEYLSPNTNKPLHLGHLRNGSVGSAVANILEAAGNSVIKANLVNDRGVHICKSMLAWELFGNGETPESTGMKGDHFVGKYYVRFSQEAKEDPSLNDQAQEMLKKWEEGDEEVVALWKKMNGWVYDGFDETYKSLGFGFDIFYYESNTYKLGKDIVDEGVKKGVFYKDEKGSLVFDLPKSFGLNQDGSRKKVIVLRSDGTSVYVTQDLGTAVKKVQDNKLDSSIYVVGSEQDYHFRCLFEIIKSLGYSWADKLLHLSYGMVNLPDGKMKSREGTVVDADNLLAEVQELALKGIRERVGDNISEEEANERAHKIALGAIKFYLLRVNPSQTIRFNPKESLSFEGFTGPYCQYSYARAMSILKEANVGIDKSKIDFSVLGTSGELMLAQKIMMLSERIQNSAENLNPSILSTHIFEMAKFFNQFYHKSPVLSVESDLKLARLSLVRAFAQSIDKGLGLLGIETMEEM